jgi:hypothetical protein
MLCRRSACPERGYTPDRARRVPTPGGNVLFAGLHLGIFPLVLGLILVGKMLPGTTDVKTDDWRLPVFPGCPAWMSHMARGLYVYALVNFAVFFLTNLLSTGTATLSMSYTFGAGDPSIASWRGFSSIWMEMGSTGLALLTGAFRASKGNNGHSVRSSHGAPVDENSNRR